MNKLQKLYSRMHDSLIISLVQHPRFGWLLQPLFASYSPETEVYTITETARAISPTFQLLDTNEQAIVRLGESCSNKNLARAYSKEENEDDFLRKVTESTIETYIRPFIEKKQGKLIELIRTTSTPLFLRESIRVRDFRGYQVIEVLREPSAMVFHFRNKEVFTYHAEVQNRDSTVNLFEQFFAPLVSNPAVAVIGNRLHHFVDVDVKKLKPFFKKKYIEVPRRSVPEYIRGFVVQCVKNYTVKSKGILLFEQEYHPVAVLTLERDFDSRQVLTLHFHYGKFRFAMDKPYKKEVEVWEEKGEFRIGWFYRDEAWEREQVQLLNNGGLSLSRTRQFVVSNNQGEGADPLSMVEWINQHGELLKRFELEQATGKQLYYTGEIDLQFNVDEGTDWFDIKCIVRFGDVEIPFINFREHVLHQMREYVLPDGRVAVLPLEWFSRFEEMFRYGTISGKSVRLQNYHFRLKQLAVNGSFIEETFMKRENVEYKEVEIPPMLNATLRPYQAGGFQWLVHLQQNGFGGCLADDMGLGKTLQTIALLLHTYSGSCNFDSLNAASYDERELVSSPGTSRQMGLSASRKLRQKEDCRKNAPRQLSLFDDFTKEGSSDLPDRKASLPPSLIVMPTSLIHNWVNEFEKFAPGFELYIHAGAQRFRYNEFEKAIDGKQIILTTYGIVRQDIDFLCRYPFHYLILDESQYIKNQTSQIFSRVKQLHATYRLALTGTPVENSLSDLWSQMDFLNEGILGKHGEFKALFRESNVMNDNEKQQRLLKIIDPFILRRTKEAVAPELPPLVEETIYCEMDEVQAALYTEVKSGIRNALIEQEEKDERGLAAIALTGLTRLRQLANHPSLSIGDYQGGAAKFDQIIEQADILFAGNHKVLIFSSFVKHLRLLADRFEEHGWRYAWLTGSTTNREEAINRFNSDESIQAFFISLKAGGTGLNLTAADYVFIIDPWWNPAAEMQAVSRAHRIGQDKKVTLYRFITKGTVEEKIQRLQRYKKELTDTVIRPKLSMEEIQELLD